MKLIDADAYAEEMKKRQDACKEWTQRTIDTGDEENYLRSCGAYAVFVEAKLLLENQPTIDVDVKHGEWIPCSERLPEERGFYLVSVGAPYKTVRVYEYKPCEGYENENLWKSDDGSYCFNWFVKAWMPLPEPWKGAER